MDFKDAIKLLGERVNSLKGQVNTEEATKNAFIMPFIKELGYDVFNPLEVVPEFTADIGIKQGEKIDYAIIQNNEPIILIECKNHAQSLNVNNASQLFRYFHTTKAKFSILTNGIEYRFYTDLVATNKMDDKPFFSFDITEIKPAEIDELKKFHKAYFNTQNIINTANELKFVNELKNELKEELTNPSSDFIRHFAKKVYPGVITQKVLDMFTDLCKKSFSQYVNDIITDRLKSALTKEKETQNSDLEIKVPIIEPENKVVTTQEEMEGFMIVKSILRKSISASRIVYRDAQSYFAILLDDNNRKTICRLYFSSTKMQIAFIDENKKEVKHDLVTMDDIFNHSDSLLSAVKSFDEKVVKQPTV